MKKPHKHADKIKAWADGFVVEYYDPMSNKWFDVGDHPEWLDHIQYRVKLQPKLVPFDTIKDAGKLIGKTVISKETGSTYLIIGVSKHSKEVCVGNVWVRLFILLENYNFLDGSPCGKYIEE